MMIRKCKTEKNEGFVLLQVLLGLVVLVAIMTGWAIHMNRVHKENMARRVSNEMNYIINAATSFYVHEDNTWPTNMAELLSKHYLEPQTSGTTKMVNPYDQDYTITTKKEPNQTLLYLSTKIPENDAFVARYAMGALPFATLSDPSGGFVTLTIYLPEPGSSGPLASAVKQVVTVPSGYKITKPACNVTGMVPAIYTSVASCGSVNGETISACRTYAQNLNSTTWVVHMQVLTNLGWSDPGWTGTGGDIGKIEVISKCQMPQ